MSAREAILGRIRAALREGRAADAATVSEVEQSIAQPPAHPRPLGEWDPVSRFVERANSLSSTIDTVPALNAVPAAVARYLAMQKLPLRAVCWPALADLPWNNGDLAVEARQVRDGDMVGITGVFAAVADTGTLMLLSGSDTHAAVSLLPETHIAVLPVSRIVPYMEDAWRMLASERGRLPRAVNFVSGPSRTADIEQTLYLGAHGPYRVHIVLVEGA